MISSCYETKEITPSPFPMVRKAPLKSITEENKPPLVVTNLETISFQNQYMENRYFHFEKYLQKVKNKKHIGIEDIKAIKKYVEDCEIRNISVGRRKYICQTLIRLAEIQKLQNITQHRLYKLIHNIHSMKYVHNPKREISYDTKRTYLIILKDFLIYLKKSIAEEIIIPKNEYTHKIYLLDEELQKILNKIYQTDPDMAFMITLLYQTGARRCEFFNIRFSDIKIETVCENKQHKKRIIVRLVGKTEGGKTVERWAPVYCYTEYLRYIGKSKINSQDYLITKSQNKYSYSIFLKRFKKRFLEAGWKQKINLKMLRHSRAAEYTKKGLNEPYMRKLFGWSKDSTMPSYYVELVMVEPKNWLDHIYLFSRNRVRENLPNPALQNRG